MKKVLFLLIMVCFVPSLCAQEGYWQQKVDYTIDVTLDDKKDMLYGKETLVYTNNSPDDLKELYFHLYWNAFKLGSNAMKHANQMGDEETLDMLSKLTKKDEGYIKVNSIKVNNISYNLTIYESIAQLKLEQPIKPGQNANIEISFESLIPSCINRAGKNNKAGTDYTITQWYPKICRYDKQGWHTDQYLGREFAGTFGRYNVTVRCARDFVVAGTGVLENRTYKEKGWQLGSDFTDNDKDNYIPWKFTADNVHDFAFAAEKEWVYKTMKVNGVDFHFFYHDTEEFKPAWSTLLLFWPEAFEICEKEFGKYPYPQFSFIQGGEGYMEYPMCTMLEAGREDFFSTACHEFMHNYFYGMYGTDENLHHWMDEGLTSYGESRLSVVVSGATGNPATEAGLVYKWIRTQITEEPIATSANYYATDWAYYNGAYYKGQLFPELIRYIIGDSIMRIGFHEYYQRWKFKHPEPNDFVKNFEDVSGMELTWFQNYWLNTNKTIDFAVDSIQFKGNELNFNISNNGSVPMPIELCIEMVDGSKKYFYIPIELTNNPKTDFRRPTTLLSYWPAAVKKYRVAIENIKKPSLKSITLDPDGYLPDLKMENNVYVPVK